MKRNTDHIQTTHGGSLPRPSDLVQMMFDKIEGKATDEAAFAARIKSAVAEIVKKQLDAGIDIVSDGEMSKTGFSNYACQRLSGFSTESGRFVARDMAEVMAAGEGRGGGQQAGSAGERHIRSPIAVGPVAMQDHDSVKTDVANFKAALGSRSPDDAFICAVTPSHMVFQFPNRYYKNNDDYLEACANAMAEEYEAIVGAGFNLQLDSPDLAMCGHSHNDGGAPLDIKKHVPMAIEALNHATRNIPPEKMRLHLCWGNYSGPHHKDVELQEIIGPVLKTRADWIYFEAANPRHEHEWEVFETVKLPAGKGVIPGVIDSVSTHVEHPRLVAQRIERFASLVGKENVVAGTDCGFGTFVGWSGVGPQTVWLKLQSLAEGARLASKKLWGK
jgi:5-methyltetrahydropteroyltriglutamate--homocysteine methyltransferase